MQDVKTDDIAIAAETFSANIEKAAAYLKDTIVEVSPQVFDMTVKAVQMKGCLSLIACMVGLAAATWGAKTGLRIAKKAEEEVETSSAVGGIAMGAVAGLIGLIAFFGIVSTNTWMQALTPELYLTLKSYSAVGIDL